jgi:hypothetical protein
MKISGGTLPLDSRLAATTPEREILGKTFQAEPAGEPL